MPPDNETQQPASSNPPLSNEASKVINRYAKHLRSGAYSANTIASYRSHLTAFITRLEIDHKTPFHPALITTEYIEKHLVHFKQIHQVRKRTQSLRLLVIRHFLDWLIELKILNHNPAANITLPTEKQKGPLYGPALSIRLSSAMIAELNRLRKDEQEPLAEVIRRAVRFFLDEQAKLSGSRRSYTNELNKRMDDLTEMMQWHFVCTQLLIADANAMMMANVLEIPDNLKDYYSTNSMLETARELTRKYGWTVKELLAHTFELAKLEEEKALYSREKERAKKKK